MEQEIKKLNDFIRKDEQIRQMIIDKLEYEIMLLKRIIEIKMSNN